MARRARPARISLGGILAAIALGTVAAVPAAAQVPAALERVSPAIGASLFTHGPDPRPPASASRTVSGSGAVSRSGGGSPERAPVCAGDYYQHVLYGHPIDSPDRLAELRPEIQAVVRGMNAMLNAESLASGGPSVDYKMRCDDSGEIAVDGFTSSGPTFAQIVSGARAAGFGSGRADYLVFFDGAYGASCGISSYTRDERLVADNRNNTGGGYGVVYSGCWYVETLMHESAHLMGAVQYGAPHSTGSGGHCFEEADVMCYSPDGGDLNQTGAISTCPGEARLDCGFDDYFDAAPEPGEYLESHWNLGSPLNRYLAFDGGEATASAPAPAKWHALEFTVPRRARRLEVSLRGGEDITLYVRRRTAPTRELFACRARSHASTATCGIRQPRRGRWVAAALRPSGSPAAALRIKARVDRDRQASGGRVRSKSRIWRPAE